MGHGPGGDGRHHPDAGRVARTYVLDAACQRRQDGRHATGTVSPDVRRSTPAAAALAAALTLAACGGGETAAGGATSSSDSTADCEGITAAITDTLTRALDATVSVDELTAAQQDELDRLVDVVEAWGLGPVSVTIQPVYE